MIITFTAWLLQHVKVENQRRSKLCSHVLLLVKIKVHAHVHYTIRFYDTQTKVKGKQQPEY